MAKAVSLSTYLMIVVAVFVAMIVVTVVVFLAVERAAHHIPGARPDLKIEEPAAPVAPSGDAAKGS